MERKRAVLILAIAVALSALSVGWTDIQAAESVTDWAYPNGDSRNTAALNHVFGAPLGAPVLAWQLESPAPHRFWGSYGTDVVISDTDNDSELEIVVAQGRGFSAPQRLSCRSLRNGDEEWAFELDEGENVQDASPNILDLDGDGFPEVLSGAGDRVIALDGVTGTLKWETDLPVPMCLIGESFSQDGEADVFTSSYYGDKLCYRLNGETGTIVWSSPSGGGSAYNAPAVADIDGDGQLEILFHVHEFNPSREMEVCMAPDGNVVWRFAATPSREQSEQSPPELGWTPDFGYVSSIVGDFTADGVNEVFFATRCNAYVLTSTGRLLWKTPLAEGYGVMIQREADGSEVADIHGTGGNNDFAAAGDLNGDGALDAVLGLDPEYRSTWYRDSGVVTYTDVRRNNRIVVLDGRSGETLWEFEGRYVSEQGLEEMRQPILVDLDGDGLLDVIALSTDGTLYGLRGVDGERLWSKPLPSTDSQLVAGSAEGKRLYILVIALEEGGTPSTLTCYILEEGVGSEN